MAAKPDEQANGSSGEDASHDKDPPSGSSSTLDSDVDAVNDKTACTDPANTDPANTNHGKLIIDATCAPADIRYPTDVSLLNEAREKTDEIIDTLHHPLVGKSRRPRTYRKRAAREFKAFIRKKRPGRNVIRKAIRKQLGYLRRNLEHIERLLQNPTLAR